jgi:hypothetical protein
MLELATRVSLVIGRVVEEAIRSAGCKAVVILDDGSPEAKLLSAWCRRSLGDGRVWLAQEPDSADEESLRLTARVLAREQNALPAHPANKTALLLGRQTPPEPLLPLGDLYATQIAALTGGWSAPAEVVAMADQAGGIDALDNALRAMFEGRKPAQHVLADLPEPARGPFLEAVQRGRFWRERAGLIPKLSTRTIGIDLFA